MAGSGPKVVFRVDEEQRARLERAAKEAGLTMSEFARDACERAILYGWFRDPVTDVEIVEQGAAVSSSLGMKIVVPAGRCPHPVQALRRVDDADVCGACGHTLRRY